ncbi:hypothetical protein [Bathymodiolus thermophilus thioautotrophic gill symbiont]|uniref:Uncharacterized protein n=1 Tax=Bathymodiolus thermophilus thioautotrophic gill symbiont TaxID=2360 RepID=A0A1J5U6F8_9GAMM|nr:hypothetical protein [Bathymodiolus thermophilus thioautotrophic gill symbiont]OIR23985.1 hypothetical protein BGC33_02235 [Bathymodiolus thermophilus thioautotrophic gill symbiont]
MRIYVIAIYKALRVAGGKSTLIIKSSAGVGVVVVGLGEDDILVFDGEFAKGVVVVTFCQLLFVKLTNEP